MGTADNSTRLADLRAPTLVLYAIQGDIFSPTDEQRLIDAMSAGCEPFWSKQYGAADRPASGEQTDLGHNLPWEAAAGRRIRHRKFPFTRSLSLADQVGAVEPFLPPACRCSTLAENIARRWARPALHSAACGAAFSVR